MSRIVIRTGARGSSELRDRRTVVQDAPVEVSINTEPFTTAPGGIPLEIEVVNTDDVPKGQKVGGKWQVPDGIVRLFNSLGGLLGNVNAASGAVEPYNLPDTPYTLRNSANQAQGTGNLLSVTGGNVPVADVAWTNSDGSAESTPFGQAIVCSIAPPSGSIAVAVSNATPTFGQSITITATPTGFTPTSYLFFAYDGSKITWIAEQAGAAVNWTVSVVGSFEVYALGTDGALEVYGLTNVTAASALVCDSIATAPVAGFSVARRLSINYLGDAMLIRRSSDNAVLSIGFIGEAVDTAAIAAFVGANNSFTATIFNQFGVTNATQVTAANQPTIVVTGTIQTLGGRPTVVFDGSTDEMTLASSITAVHGFTVARKASNTNLLQYLLGGNGQGIVFGGTLGVFTSILIISAGGSLISGVDNTLPHQVTFRMGTAGAGRLRVDGALTASGTTSANLVLSRIGTREDVALRHIGSFSEVILYSSALSDSDQSVIESNQISYYGI